MWREVEDFQTRGLVSLCQHHISKAIHPSIHPSIRDMRVTNNVAAYTTSSSCAATAAQAVAKRQKYKYVSAIIPLAFESFV